MWKAWTEGGGIIIKRPEEVYGSDRSLHYLIVVVVHGVHLQQTNKLHTLICTVYFMYLNISVNKI